MKILQRHLISIMAVCSSTFMIQFSFMTRGGKGWWRWSEERGGGGAGRPRRAGAAGASSTASSDSVGRVPRIAPRDYDRDSTNY